MYSGLVRPLGRAESAFHHTRHRLHHIPEGVLGGVGGAFHLSGLGGGGVGKEISGGTDGGGYHNAGNGGGNHSVHCFFSILV